MQKIQIKFLIPLAVLLIGVILFARHHSQPQNRNTFFSISSGNNPYRPSQFLFLRLTPSNLLVSNASDPSQQEPLLINKMFAYMSKEQRESLLFDKQKVPVTALSPESRKSALQYVSYHYRKKGGTLPISDAGAFIYIEYTELPPDRRYVNAVVPKGGRIADPLKPHAGLVIHFVYGPVQQTWTQF